MLPVCRISPAIFRYCLPTRCYEFPRPHDINIMARFLRPKTFLFIIFIFVFPPLGSELESLNSSVSQFLAELCKSRNRPRKSVFCRSQYLNGFYFNVMRERSVVTSRQEHAYGPHEANVQIGNFEYWKNLWVYPETSSCTPLIKYIKYSLYYYTILYYTILYYTILYYTILYYTSILYLYNNRQ